MPLIEEIFILSTKPRCLAFWIYDMDIIDCFFVKMKK